MKYLIVVAHPDDEVLERRYISGRDREIKWMFV